MIYETIPEIKRCNLSNVVLYLKVLGIDDVIGFDYFESPSKDQLAEALESLHMLNALNESGNITEIGEKMSHFPLEPFLSKMIIESFVNSEYNQYYCIDIITIIVSMVSVENIYMTKKYTKKILNKTHNNNNNNIKLKANYNNNTIFTSATDSNNNNKEVEEEYHKEMYRNDCIDHAHAILRHPLGDIWTFISIYIEWGENHYSIEWCEKNYIQYRALKYAKNIREQLYTEINKILINNNNNKNLIISDLSSNIFTSNYEIMIGKILSSSLYMNIAR